MGPNGVGLKYHSDRSLIGWNKYPAVIDQPVFDKDFSTICAFQSGKAPERCGFSTSARTQKCIEFSFFDIERDSFHRVDSPVFFLKMFDSDDTHRFSIVHNAPAIAD